MSTRKYFSLVIKEPGEGERWSQQFGDYDRTCVADELRDNKDHIGTSWPKGTKFKIISSADDQASIDACVAKLNQI